MNTIKYDIAFTLLLLEDDDVAVNISGKDSNVVRINHVKHHAMSIKLKWLTDRFVGYLDEAENSHAILSLGSIPEAQKFVCAYKLFVELRANRKA